MCKGELTAIPVCVKENSQLIDTTVNCKINDIAEYRKMVCSTLVMMKSIDRFQMIRAVTLGNL
jgi:hypothetical protein